MIQNHNMFIENQYTFQYYSIVNNAKAKLPNGTTRKQAKLLLSYTERHHVIPKSLGGTNDKNNLVYAFHQLCRFSHNVGK